MKRFFNGVLVIQAVFIVIFVHGAAPTDDSVDPPFGNSPFLRVNASGVQIYSCQKSSDGVQYKYKRVGATAKLYTLHSTPNAVGYHYYLTRPLAQGGQPTFSFSNAEGDPISAVPESTVTGISIAISRKVSTGDIEDVLLKATSHSGYGQLSKAAYIQRRYSKGGVPDPGLSSCTKLGQKLQIPYSAQYVFWSQDRILPSSMIPPEISISQRFTPLLSLYAEGFQHYIFNGSSWVNVNATAFLYNSPGQEVVGRHYFLEQTDERGGKPSWEIFMPLMSRLTAMAVNTVSVDQDNISWSKLEATSYSGEKRYFGEVKYVQRLSTLGGLPPPIKDGSAKLGDKFMSPYSAIYWFYVEKL